MEAPGHQQQPAPPSFQPGAAAADTWSQPPPAGSPGSSGPYSSGGQWGLFLAGQYPGQCCSPQGLKHRVLWEQQPSWFVEACFWVVKCDRHPGERRGCRNGPAHQGGSHAARGCWGAPAGHPRPGPGLPDRHLGPQPPLQLLSRPPTAAPVFWTLGRPVRLQQPGLVLVNILPRLQGAGWGVSHCWCPQKPVAESPWKGG